ncbi:hypothetical protein BUALT_Bualt07G0072100 [Buddleja alternifolia]|uniref:Myb/SANT-like domain-containing protein n=1 Tax=Buddleja alternifolia TaxID=168488 RepID=A0AAV6XDC3_9LAMI|nr:hypothetical protein BUALT_Bualt07G0072100 [Buddleja alternifolia]
MTFDTGLGWDNLKNTVSASDEWWDEYLQTGLNYDKKQLKNHWDSTKQDWKVWYKLMTFATGLGWDNPKNTVSASDEWWDEYLQANPDAAKFRYKGLENFEELTSLFKEGYATGKNAWALSEGSLPNDSSGPCETQSSKNMEQVDSDVEVCHKRARDLKDEIPPPEHSRKVTAVANIDKYLSCICEIVKAMGKFWYMVFLGPELEVRF